MRIQHQFLLCYSLFLLFLATTTLISPSHGDLGKCHPSDFKALMKMKNSITMSQDVYSSWFQNTDCCNWIGITCDDKTNRTVEIILFVGEISGKIPPSVGDLSHLIGLTFRHFKNITGSIPQSITKLKHLVLLDLSDMSLSGPVPNFLNQLTLLNRLVLSNNQFSGSIPPNLSDLKNIRNIYLDGNKLTGSIPESFGKFTGTAPALYLARNKLTGPIPKSLGALAYSDIDLSRNKLTGDASILINPKHDLTTFIDLSRNQFEFDLSKVKFPKDLNWFDISHNKIFGAIPDEIKNLESLNQLKVGYNRLCGKIPTGGIMKRFKRTSFFHNKCLCGSPLLISCKKK
ncbi:hypothetical protein MKW98_000086 [Papaver atlanticum]|uniref:Leucine-rich repeat-containing N-terminal plant-type domain-containing protein n=1 Tax=Papaver atlanticum TaxID=357466 RepID=A0AAD4XJ66_9MAGN|nr:hypothetical protein MKW98_000086 [Papaver atlanticum]